jgi:membrane protein
MVSKIIYFIDKRIWEIRLKDISPFKSFLVKCLRVILLASRGFSRDHCYKTASVLTYYSLLNIVPLVAVAFGIAKGFGLEKLIQRQILQIAEKANWQADLTTQILNFSHRLLETTKGGVIAGIGVVMLFWTVISILGKIEGAFNEIWEIKKARTFVRKFSDYISLIVFAPILIIISSSATVLIASQLKIIMNKIALLGIFSSIIIFLLNILPYVSIWILLILLYLVMPNTKIPIRSAILGGFSAGTVAQIIQWIYIKFQIGASKYGAIYGSFAALPLLLIWLQITWMIVLFGAEIAHASEHYETYGFYPDYSRISLSSKKLLILRIFHLITKRFSNGEKPLNAREISNILEIPIRLVKQLLNELIDIGLVVETTKGTKGEVTFQPGKTIEYITVKSALDEYERYGTAKIPDFQTEDTKKIKKFLKEISDMIDQSPSNVKLKEI